MSAMLTMKSAFSICAMLALSSMSLASVTFSVVFDHWSYTVTGSQASRLTVTTNTSTTNSAWLSASTGAFAFPEGGDNPGSDSVSAMVTASAVFKVTATKTVGDPFTGVTWVHFNTGLAMDAHASCSNFSSCQSQITGSMSFDMADTITAAASNHNTQDVSHPIAWGGNGTLQVGLTQKTTTTYEGYCTLEAGYLSFYETASAPSLSYNEAEATGSGSLNIRNVYASTS